MSTSVPGVVGEGNARRREEPTVGRVEATVARISRWEEQLIQLIAPLVLTALRLLLGAVFVWFGALKVTGSSPVYELVSRTLPWFPGHTATSVLGALELVLGLALVLGLLPRVVLPVLVAHLAGTFLTFAMVPAMMFRDANPLLLTEDGEFVVKNLILISAGLVLLTQVGGAAPAARVGGPRRSGSGRRRTRRGPAELM